MAIRSCYEVAPALGNLVTALERGPRGAHPLGMDKPRSRRKVAEPTVIEAPRKVEAERNRHAKGQRARFTRAQGGKLSEAQRAKLDPEHVAALDKLNAVENVVATRRIEDRFAAYPHLREVFLRKVAETGSRDAACVAARVRWQSVVAWASKNPEFAEELELAMQEHRALIEKAVYTRGIDGVDEARFSSAGVFVGTVKRYSDTLLLAYARRHIPEYRQGDEKKLTVDGSVMHASVALNPDDLSPQQRRALRCLLSGKSDPGESVKEIPYELVDEEEEKQVDATDNT